MKFPDKVEDYDHSWNFVTFTHSFVEKKSVAFVKFGHSQETLKLVWENNKKDEPTELTFRVGGCSSYKDYVWNGKYYDISF